jgi:hypothetical protein
MRVRARKWEGEKINKKQSGFYCYTYDKMVEELASSSSPQRGYEFKPILRKS